MIAEVTAVDLKTLFAFCCILAATMTIITTSCIDRAKKEILKAIEEKKK